MVHANNNYSDTGVQQLLIKVQIDSRDTPVFRKNPVLSIAMPDKEYQINLFDLIESKPGFMINNNIHFKIDRTHYPAEWAEIDANNPTILHGHISPDNAGKKLPIELIASSNTGGDSSVQSIEIPVAFDPKKRPRVQPIIHFTTENNKKFELNLLDYIQNPNTDKNIIVKIDSASPEFSWMSVCDSDPLLIEGVIPSDATGKLFQIPMHAETPEGGSSDPFIIALQVATDPVMRPSFYQANPQLDLFYSGQSYLYDFVKNKDVYPLYEAAPYIIEFAAGASNPSWLKIVNNQLIAEKVPVLPDSTQSIYVTIRNTPGGLSEVIKLPLTVVNQAK